MKPVQIIPIMITILFASLSCSVYADSEPSYDDTVALIRTTMGSNPSAVRQERYDYIQIDDCVLNYKVTGSFPVDTFYEIRFSGIDFSSLNSRQSRLGHDYTDFVLLNFTHPAIYRMNAADIPIHSVVINTADDTSAKILFKAFSRLGELCVSKTGRTTVMGSQRGR